MNLSGSPFDYLVAFAAGVLLSFTPCVYPLIPISVGFITAGAEGSRMKGFILSLAFVSGVAATYSALGLIASLTGTIFGAISAHPVSHIAAGVVIMLFGLSMLELFNIRLPSVTQKPATKKHTFVSAFALGLVSGLIVYPCLTPALGSILVYLATRKNIVYGSTLLIAFAYGMGLILILAGTFSSLLAALPKFGKWMLIIKKFCAIVLIVFGLYFIYSGIRGLSNV